MVHDGVWDILAGALQRFGLRSLRSQMFACLLGPLLLITALSSAIAYLSSIDKANAVMDQMLIGSARMIGGNISLTDNLLYADIPPAALENLRTGSGDAVYYRVDSPRSGLISGTPEIPAFAGKLGKEGWQASDGVFRDQHVRLLAFAQPIYPFGEGDTAIIQVASTLGWRNAQVVNSWLRISWHLGLLLIFSGMLGALWTRAALAPVLRIGKIVRDRPVDDEAGLLVEDAPEELTPLVHSINDHINRINHYVRQQDRFISNAAHQLKTPLTVLNTQITVGLRSQEPDVKQSALAASHETLRNCIHMTKQLLTLSATDHISGSRIPETSVNLHEVVRAVLENHAELAATKGIDLGLGTSVESSMIEGVPIMIETLVTNLVDNAIRYTPNNGVVTVSIKSSDDVVELEVEDSGPGIPIEEREHVFERYYRLASAADQDGCGLGLAIVKEIVLSSRAHLDLLDPDGKRGLLVRVRFSRYGPNKALGGSRTPA